MVTTISNTTNEQPYNTYVKTCLGGIILYKIYNQLTGQTASSKSRADFITQVRFNSPYNSASNMNSLTSSTTLANGISKLYKQIV